MEATRSYIAAIQDVSVVSQRSPMTYSGDQLLPWHITVVSALVIMNPSHQPQRSPLCPLCIAICENYAMYHAYSSAFDSHSLFHTVTPSRRYYYATF